jgi:hypothetical protein
MHALTASLRTLTGADLANLALVSLAHNNARKTGPAWRTSGRKGLVPVYIALADLITG